MSEQTKMDRRQAMKMLAATGLAGFSGIALAASQKSIGAMIPGKGWVEASGEKCAGDGTPLQFMPKTPPDDNPLQDELKKYPRCPYCGMNRTKWHHSRHLVQYDDGLVDGTCSIHCLAISLSLNIDRGPKAIYAADFGSDAKIKPLINVDTATYLIGSELPGTMTPNSKMAFSHVQTAEAFQKEEMGELAKFDGALQASYADMAKSTMGIRKRRAERVRRMRQKMMKKG